MACHQACSDLAGVAADHYRQGARLWGGEGAGFTIAVEVRTAIEASSAGRGAVTHAAAWCCCGAAVTEAHVDQLDRGIRQRDPCVQMGNEAAGCALVDP